MPEGPEVEFARRSLAAWVAGRRIVRVHVEDPAVVRTKLSTLPGDLLPDGAAWAHGLVGVVPDAPIRHGKRIGWVLGHTAALGHLGMTGKWVRRAPGDVPRFARLGLDVGDAVVWFADARRFGCVAPVAPERLHEALRDGLGPDAIADAPDAQVLAARFGTARAIKVALLDQARLAGVGNIHAVEALWRARIHPDTPGTALRPADWERLAEGLRAQMVAALAMDADADEIAYVEEGRDNPFAVYDRADLPCPRCGRPVASIAQSGRATFWCPGCQRRLRRDSRAARSSR